MKLVNDDQQSSLKDGIATNLAAEKPPPSPNQGRVVRANIDHRFMMMAMIDHQKKKVEFFVLLLLLLFRA